MRDLRIGILVIVGACIFCGCNSDGYNWCIKNDGRNINGNKAVAGTDIGICSIEVVEPCVIAVIDSGIANEDYCADSYDVVDKTKVVDGSVHGAEIANILISLVDNDGAMLPYVLIDIKLEPSNMSPENIIKAIEYAEKCGARVVNCSWSVNWVSDELEEKIRYSQMLFVFAAGNDHDDKCEYPATLASQIDNVISVGGINCQGGLAYMSNYGGGVNIAAPAMDIKVKNDDGAVVYVNGTSFATPFVSGVAAYGFAAYPNYTAEQMKVAIMESAERNILLKGYIDCGGWVNLKNTLKYIKTQIQQDDSP